MTGRSVQASSRGRRSPALALAFVAAMLLGAAAWWAATWPQADRATGDAVWGEDYFPNVELTDQDGRRVRFFDDLVEGKVVAINFVFTACSASCSLETARLREVQELLGGRVGRDVHFYSITIDPDNDSPQALKDYAGRFGVGPGWLFLTGRREDITLLRERLGVYDPDEAVTVTNNHSLHLVIGNQATGRWMKRSPFENPYILANELGNWLHNWKQPAARGSDYDQAPQLRRMTQGEELFRVRCAACHALGQAGPAALAAQRLGPDLTGVTTRRERDWLKRWIKAPDRMLADKDPLALQLLAQYNQVAMPNLRLSDTEVEALIGHLEAQGGAARR